MNLSTTVKKEELLEILKTNKENHIKLYKDSLAGVKKKYQDELKDRVNKIAADIWTNISISYNPPLSYEKDYDRAIRSVELNVNSTIDLDMNNFNNLVMDEWGWTNNWYISNSAYSNITSGCAVGRGYL